MVFCNSPESHWLPCGLSTNSKTNKADYHLCYTPNIKDNTSEAFLAYSRHRLHQLWICSFCSFRRATGRWICLCSSFLCILGKIHNTSDDNWLVIFFVLFDEFLNRQSFSVTSLDVVWTVFELNRGIWLIIAFVFPLIKLNENSSTFI